MTRVTIEVPVGRPDPRSASAHSTELAHADPRVRNLDFLSRATTGAADARDRPRSRRRRHRRRGSRWSRGKAAHARRRATSALARRARPRRASHPDAGRRPPGQHRRARGGREQRQGGPVPQPACQRRTLGVAVGRRGVLRAARSRGRGREARGRGRIASRCPVVGGGTRTIDVVPWDLAQAPHVDASAMLAPVLRRGAARSACRWASARCSRRRCGCCRRPTCQPCSSRWRI